ncbi:Uncharacterised protein [Mycobacteroides abscessus subsp. abscessus]|nr:Uncharacterised protein [Mycobacteroides abscessus subsp. abscessus]
MKVLNLKGCKGNFDFFQLFFLLQVVLGDGRLDLQRLHLAFELIDDIIHPVQVFLGF